MDKLKEVETNKKCLKCINECKQHKNTKIIKCDFKSK